MTAGPDSPGGGGTLVVGAGLSGLTCALYLARAGRRVLLVEAGASLGGNLQTRTTGGPTGDWLLELGPNSFGDASEELMQLARDVSLEHRLVRAGDAGARRFLYADGRLQEVPSHPVKFFLSPLLPLRGRLRLMREPWVPPRAEDAPEETLAEFCDRRLGEAARRRLLTPVVGGIYAGDPERLGAESAFPRMIALEREHGSLIRAARKGSGPPKRGRLSSFAGGLAELPRAIERALEDRVAKGFPVKRLERTDDGWTATTTRGDGFRAERLVIATPARAAAALLRPLAPDIATELEAIDYAPMAVVHVGLETAGIGRLPPGFGFLVPRNEGLRILGAINSSQLFPGRAPRGHELLTVFAGGRLDPEAPSLADDALRGVVLDDLGRALGGIGEPRLFEVTRWPRAIPQYEVGHLARVARIEAAAAALPGLHLLGNWRGGIAMPACVQEGRALADRLAQLPA